MAPSTLLCVALPHRYARKGEAVGRTKPDLQRRGDATDRPRNDDGGADERKRARALNRRPTAARKAERRADGRTDGEGGTKRGCFWSFGAVSKTADREGKGERWERAHSSMKCDDLIWAGGAGVVERRTSASNCANRATAGA